MTVREPSQYGLIVRKGPYTRAPLRQLQDECPLYEDDGHIVGVSVGGSVEALAPWLQRLERAGLERGRNFVVTRSGSGVLGDVPAWLLTERLPTGNPPELEAAMEPVIREMWQRGRKRVYSLRPSEGQDSGRD